MGYKVLNKTKTEAEIHIYEDIGGGWFGGVTASQVKDDLKKLGDKITQLDVRINSPGGSVFEGVTIYNLLKSHDANVTTYIDGLAASIASIVAMAGDKIIMAENSLMMIHKPHGIVVGTSDDYRKGADVLDTVEDTLINTYSNRTSTVSELIKDMMKEETWMTAEEALELGFADEISEDMKIAAYSVPSRYFEQYHKIPEGLQKSSAKQHSERLAHMNAVIERTVPKAVRNKRKSAQSGGN